MDKNKAFERLNECLALAADKKLHPTTRIQACAHVADLINQYHFTVTIPPDPPPPEVLPITPEVQDFIGKMLSAHEQDGKPTVPTLDASDIPGLLLKLNGPPKEPKTKVKLFPTAKKHVYKAIPEKPVPCTKCGEQIPAGEEASVKALSDGAFSWRHLKCST